MRLIVSSARRYLARINEAKQNPRLFFRPLFRLLNSGLTLFVGTYGDKSILNMNEKNTFSLIMANFMLAKRS